MFKHVASFCLIILLLLTSSTVDARQKKNKKKSRTHVSSRSAKISKKGKHKRKSRRYRRGNGPDLKTITTDSPYTDAPNNGINSIETKEKEL